MPYIFDDNSATSTAHDLERLAQRAAGLQATMRGIQDAAPERTKGTDRTGAVRVAVGADGLPESIQVDERWATQIRPHALGTAVTEAFQNAAHRRGEAWSRIFERASTGQPESPMPQPTAVSGIGGMPRTSAPRPLSEIAEEVIARFDSMMAAPRPGTAPAQAQGTTSGRALVLSLTESGRMSCAIDAEWASGQSGSQLNQALETALASARTELQNRVAGNAISADRSAGLLMEIQAAAREATERKQE